MYYCSFDWCCSPECLFHPTLSLNEIYLNKFIFSNIYISMNTIFECPYMFFGWERGHQLSTYATDGGIGWGSSKKCKTAYKGRGVSHLMCTYALTLFFSCFWQHFYLLVSRFICRNLTLLLFDKRCVRQKLLFFSNDINFWNKLFFT